MMRVSKNNKLLRWAADRVQNCNMHNISFKPVKAIKGYAFEIQSRVWPQGRVLTTLSQEELNELARALDLVRNDVHIKYQAKNICYSNEGFATPRCAREAAIEHGESQVSIFCNIIYKVEA